MFDEIWYLIVVCVLASLIPACYFDVTSRKIPVWTWYPAAYIGIPLSIILFTLKILFGELPIDTIYIYVGAALLMVGISLVLGYLNVFGGADAIAFSIVILTSFYYRDPINMNHPMFIFPFLGNFVIFGIIMFVAVVVINILQKNYKRLGHSGKWSMLLFAITIPPSYLEKVHSIVLEDATEINGKIIRRFIPIPTRMREHADHYMSDTIISDPARYSIYQKLDRVWIMYIVPMIVPITLAYITTIFLGDFSMIMRHIPWI